MTTKTVQRPLRLPLPPGAQTEGVVMPLQWVHHPGGLEVRGWSLRDSLSLLNPQNLIGFFLPSFRLLQTHGNENIYPMPVPPLYFRSRKLCGSLKLWKYFAAGWIIPWVSPTLALIDVQMMYYSMFSRETEPVRWAVCVCDLLYRDDSCNTSWQVPRSAVGKQLDGIFQF